MNHREVSPIWGSPTEAPEAEVPGIFVAHLSILFDLGWREDGFVTIAPADCGSAHSRPPASTCSHCGSRDQACLGELRSTSRKALFRYDDRLGLCDPFESH
jgi:hypothetical protein